MRTIAIASRKGGTGKSTIAAHLSVLGNSNDSPALLIDIDPQASLTFWQELRQADTPAIVNTDAKHLGATLEAARRDGVSWCIIDGPPHDSAEIAAMIRAADLVLIPTKAATFDIAGAYATIELAANLRKPALAVLNMVPPSRGIVEGGVTAEARKALQEMGAEVWEGVLTQRQAFAYALATGQAITEFAGDSKGATEIKHLWRDIQERLT
jgi:chromosome partitioning protein